ncbi:MAG: hypothetical protein HYX53_09780 [Chloroflexi bacterium]|nr:hypothetical protein [Chloroflexota bacterium]
MRIYDVNSQLSEMRLRSERIERKAALRASLGAPPEPAPLRLFARRKVQPLRAVVDFPGNGAGFWPEGPQAV